MKNFLLCLINVFLLVCGQLLFKIAAREKKISSVFDALNLFVSPYMIFAITLYSGATLLWVYILTKVPLSYAYPIQALAFPLIVTLSFVFFKEPVPANRLVGVGIIVLGALIASK